MFFVFFKKVKRSTCKIKKKKKLNRDFILKKEQALTLVKQRLNFYLDYYKDLNYNDNCFYFNKITIKDTKTRWGSCSSDKNLNFNYRIVDLPLELVDYIVVHELCHLKEMNHKQSFWDTVAIFLPDYKERVKKLKTVQIIL